MMGAFVTILIFLGLVLVGLQAFNCPSPPRCNLGWAGVACWGLAYVLMRFGA